MPALESPYSLLAWPLPLAMLVFVATFLQKVQGTHQVSSHISWLLWTSRSIIQLLQSPHALPNKPCTTKFQPEQPRKPCIAIRRHAMLCAAMCCHALSCACSTRPWHCAHDRPPMCMSIECLVPTINLYSVHYLQCLKALLLAI